MKRIFSLILTLLLIVTFPLNSIAEVVFYDTNHIGSPVAMWDKNGKKVWEGEYYPFGEEYRVSKTPQKNKKRFIGKEKDEETGLTYFGARYMDEKTGRFITPDPVRVVDAFSSTLNTKMLSEPQRLNRYAYGLNNPYKYIDPDGEFAIMTAVAVAWAVTEIALSVADVISTAKTLASDANKAEKAASVIALGAGVVAPGAGYSTALKSGTKAVNTTSKSSKAFPSMAPSKGRGLGSKAPEQVTPGVSKLDGYYVDDLGRVQPYEAHYDKYGRQIERTDWNAGNKSQNIPDIHHHTKEYDSNSFHHGPNKENHIEGIGPSSQ